MDIEELEVEIELILKENFNVSEEEIENFITFALDNLDLEERNENDICSMFDDFLTEEELT